MGKMIRLLMAAMMLSSVVAAGEVTITASATNYLPPAVHPGTLLTFTLDFTQGFPPSTRAKIRKFGVSQSGSMRVEVRGRPDRPGQQRRPSGPNQPDQVEA